MWEFNLALVSFYHKEHTIGGNVGKRFGAAHAIVFIKAFRAPNAAIPILVAQTKLRDQCAIAVWAFFAEVGKQTATLSNHHQEAAA